MNSNYNELEAKHYVVLDDHNNLKSKFELVAADAAKLSGLHKNIELLNSQLETPTNKPPVTIEKIVEKPVEDLTKINALTDQIISLKAALETASNKPPVTVEKIVEKPVEDLTKINALTDQIISLKAALEAANNKPPVIVDKIIEKAAETNNPINKDYKAFSKLYGKPVKADDLKLVEGIGPKIESLFHNTGLKTWAAVAATQPVRLKEILVAGGERFQMHNPATWPKQCEMMVNDKWADLKIYQDKLTGGKEPE